MTPRRRERDVVEIETMELFKYASKNLLPLTNTPMKLSKVGTNRNFGGMVHASTWGLKAIWANHRRGARAMKTTSHASAPREALTAVSFSFNPFIFMS